MKLAIFLSTILAIPCIGLAAPLVNDGSFYTKDWSTTTTFAGMATNTGTGGTAPSISDGLLNLTMAGATGSYTEVRTVLSSPTYSNLTDYVVTTRVAVNSFPGGTATANSQLLTLTRVESYDRLNIGITTTQILISGPSGGTAIDLTSLGLTNALDTFYTWQFQVHQDLTSAAGYVTIYRRDNDTGAAWTLVGENISIANVSTSPTSTSIRLGIINYSSTGAQGALQQEYYMVEAVPEPSAAVLLLGGVGTLLFWRRSRNRTMLV